MLHGGRGGSPRGKLVLRYAEISRILFGMCDKRAGPESVTQISKWRDRARRRGANRTLAPFTSRQVTENENERLGLNTSVSLESERADLLARPPESGANASRPRCKQAFLQASLMAA